MKLVTVEFVIPDEDEEALDREIRNSQLLNDWYCFAWSSIEATEEQVKWYEKEHDGDNH